MTAELPKWTVKKISNHFFKIAPHAIKLTERREAKLSTDHVSIEGVPRIVTDCSPNAVIAEFDTTFTDISSANQSDITISTG